MLQNFESHQFLTEIKVYQVMGKHVLSIWSMNTYIQMEVPKFKLTSKCCREEKAGKVCFRFSHQTTIFWSGSFYLKKWRFRENVKNGGRNYNFFFDYHINQIMSSGSLGLFMLFWGIMLIIVAVPLFSYFYGKRWYCSWEKKRAVLGNQFW